MGLWEGSSLRVREGGSPFLLLALVGFFHSLSFTFPVLQGHGEGQGKSLGVTSPQKDPRRRSYGGGGEGPQAGNLLDCG